MLLAPMILPCSVLILQLIEQFAGAAGTNDLTLQCQYPSTYRTVCWCCWHQWSYPAVSGSFNFQISLQVLLAPMILPCSVLILQLLDQFAGAASTNDLTLQCPDSSTYRSVCWCCWHHDLTLQCPDSSTYRSVCWCCWHQWSYPAVSGPFNF